MQGKLLRTARVAGEKYLFLDDPAPFVNGMKTCGTRIDLFTFLPRLPETTPKYDYPLEMDNLAVLPVSTFDHWWNHQIGFKARNKAKQAEKKGVVIREVPFGDELVKGIQGVYNESPVRQGKPNVHYGKDFDTVYREEATYLDNSIFIGAYSEDRMIGFIKMVHDETRTQAGLMNIVSMVSERDKAPTNALVAQAVRSCADRNISYLVYSNFAYGKKQESSLSDFKERNGFQRVDLPRYYVPITVFGKLAFKMGFHRRLVEQLPESLASRLRELRASWYKRRFHPGGKELQKEAAGE